MTEKMTLKHACRKMFKAAIVLQRALEDDTYEPFCPGDGKAFKFAIEGDKSLTRLERDAAKDYAEAVHEVAVAMLTTYREEVEHVLYGKDDLEQHLDYLDARRAAASTDEREQAESRSSPLDDDLPL
ncbi:hypothetical protein SLNSH_06265 [Alsobacter soli]|uniref:Uncharacterized protein n=1 Tax=Alsobacter soli TaxID=2109933 RepID=A0A2T1HWA8_9HYPH|nr:hypothetical protein [Alsobacter soli]PSC05976.1 hypothetical protein SLNSH_06265 [Alsobacter soli]